MPFAVNWTRVVDAEPKKRPPESVRIVPPSFGPKLGLQEATNGPVLELGWKLIVRVPVPVFPWMVAVPFTCAVPAEGPQSAVTAVPPVVTTETSGRPFGLRILLSERPSARLGGHDGRQAVLREGSEVRRERDARSVGNG